MASGSDILSYQGNPALALGSSDLPATSSVYVTDFDKTFQYWQNYAQRKFLADKAKFDQNNAEAAENKKRLEAAIGLGNYDIWNVDRDDFLETYYKPIREMYKKNPSAFYDSSNPDYLEASDIVGRAMQAAAFSTQQKAEYDTRVKLRDEHPESILNLDAPEKYRDAGGIMQRAELGGITYQPNIELNLLEGIKEDMDLVRMNAPTVEANAGQFGIDQYLITDTVELEKTRKALNEKWRSEWDTDINKRRAIQNAINEDTSIMDGKTDPYELFFDMKLARMNLDPRTKLELKGRSYSPYEREAAKADAKPQDSWAIDLGVELQNPNSRQYTGNLKGHENLKVAFSPSSDLRINNKPIGAFVYDENTGKQYVLAATDFKYDPKRQANIVVGDVMTKLIPLNNYYSQILQPFAEEVYKGTSYTALQDMQNYATPEVAERLKIPKKQATDNTPKTVTSPKKSYNLAELKKTVDFGKMSDSEIIQWYKTNHPEIEITK